MVSIIEDDDDGEFHHEGRPVESLQVLDREGRIVFLIVPKSLAAAFTAARWLNDLHSPTLDQQTLAEFITAGMYERHLRRLRRRNTARHEALLCAIEKYLNERVEVTGDGSGSHIVLWPKKRVSEETAIAHAASSGVGIYEISHCFLTRPPRTGLMLGYSRMNEQEIGRASDY